MGISLNKLNEKGMRCPMMGGIECMGDSCMLWSWDFDGRESTEYTLTCPVRTLRAADHDCDKISCPQCWKEAARRAVADSEVE